MCIALGTFAGGVVRVEHGRGPFCLLRPSSWPSVCHARLGLFFECFARADTSRPAEAFLLDKMTMRTHSALRSLYIRQGPRA